MIAALQFHRQAQLVEQRAMGWADSGHVFISTQNGGPCPPSTIYDAFRVIAEAAGIEPARLYDLRHTAATTLLSEGVDAATVAEVLAHASALVTLGTYAHALPHRVANASQRLVDIFNEATEEKETRRHHQTHER